MTDSSIPNAGSLNFSVDSRLLFELGEQLVAKPSIALAELVKNAYDADATQVTVSFENAGEPGGTIVIQDNGHGMTFEEITNGWMRIAASSKRINTASRVYKRPLTGAKGIGRFATRRLGASLELHSVVELFNGTHEAIDVSFNWADFMSGEDISNINVKYQRSLVSAEERLGVTLYIINAHDPWLKEDIDNLKKDLIGLVSPFPVLPAFDERDRDPGFDINVLVDGQKTETSTDGSLTQEFLEAAWGVLKAEIDEDGRASYSLEFRRTGHPTEKIIDDIEKYTYLPFVKLTVYFHQFEFKNAYSGLPFTISDARRLGREYGGVRIFLDHFRIYPYGEQSDDWIRLADMRSRNVDMANSLPMSDIIRSYGKAAERPYLNIPGNNQLFGYITLSQTLHASDTKPIMERLNVKASREGFLENQVFEQLRRFVQRGIYWLTMQYSSILQISSKTTPDQARTSQKITETRKRLEDLPSQIAGVVLAVAEEPVQTELSFEKTQPRYDRQKTVEKIVEAVTLVVNPIHEDLDGVEQGYIAEQEELMSVIAMLRLLASAGSSLLVMEHQFSPVLRTVSGIKADVIRLRDRIPTEIVERYDRLVYQIEDWEQLVSAIVSPLASLLNPDYRERRRRWIVYEIVEEIRRALQYYMNEHKVEFENAVPPGLRTPAIYRAELYSILLNLLTNALKAVYGYPDRRIRVEAFRSAEKHFILRMYNTGKRAPKDRWEAYFRPFISDSISDSGLGVGTGLGLSVVRDTVNEYSGSANFIDVDEPWQTGIEIKLPFRGAE